jgi:MGT family glycosyltransferase
LVPILLALQERGHDVLVRTLAGEVALLEGLGLSAAPIDAAVEAITMDDWQARGAQRRLARGVAVFAARAPHDAADLQRALDAVQPDLLLVDINAWGALAVAERWGGAWASYSPYALTLSSVDVPPFGPGLPPARGPVGRLRDRLARPLVFGALERVFLPQLNAVRTELGLPALPTVDDLVLGVPLMLSLTAEPFEYPRSDWPASVVQVGPCAWEPATAVPGWLEDLPDPIVLVTTSSEYQDDGRLVAVALEALADEPVSVIATMPAAQAARPRQVPDNARIVDYLPHSAVLERASCVITHGGMGGTQKALAHGVPVVVVPFGRDQLEVARRVEVAGAGRRLPARRLDPARLRQAVRDATSCRPGAARVAAGFAAAGGPAAAADALERQLARVG